MAPPPSPNPGRMTCPRCKTEQPTARECASCGIVIAKFRRLRDRRRPEGSALFGLIAIGVVLVVLMCGGAWAIVSRIPLPGLALFRPAVAVGADATAVATDAPPPADPPPVEAYWSEGAVGLRAATKAQLHQRIPLVIYVRRSECPECEAFEKGILQATETRGYLAGLLRARINVDDGAEERALLERLGLTDLPAIVMVRTDGARHAIALVDEGTPVRPSEFVRRCREAAGR